MTQQTFLPHSYVLQLAIVDTYVILSLIGFVLSHC